MHNFLETSFACFCGKYISEKELGLHIKSCSNYRSESEISKLLSNIKFTSMPIDTLMGIRSEIINYQRILISALEQEGKKRKPGLTPNSTPIKNDFFDPSDYSYADYTKCDHCHKIIDESDKNGYWLVNECWHTVCKECLRKHINLYFIRDKGQVKCPVSNCQQIMKEEDLTNILGKESLDVLNNELFESLYNIVKCVKCFEKFEFIKGNPDKNTKDLKGRMLSHDQLMNFVENRFTCPNSKCKTEQCRSCKAIPYHIGFTCDHWKDFNSKKKCRFCETLINMVDESKPLALQNICTDTECVQKSKQICQKTLECGHPCSGFVNEINCMECLDDDCASKSENLLGQKGSDYCVICYSEALSSAACIRARCGHIFHIHCLTTRIDMRWTNPRITFTFCECPSCKTWMVFPIDSPLYTKMEKNISKFEEIKKKSLERLKYEGKEKDKELITVGSPFYEKKLEYSLKIFSYFECFKCKISYFGGHRDCRQGDDGKEEFKPENLVCANCCEIPIQDCKTHGKDFIEFKCKFCCSIAQWFCWGSTHFCEPCHKRQVAGDYVSKLAVDKLPKCSGKASCPLKIDHKPNGEEYALGCSICRNNLENQKEF